MVSVKPLASFLTTGELLSLLQIHFLLLCTNQHPSIRKCRRGAPEPNSGLTRSRRRQLWRKPRPAASATTSPQHGCVCVTHLIEGHRTQSLIFPGKKKNKTSSDILFLYITVSPSILLGVHTFPSGGPLFFKKSRNDDDKIQPLWK